MRIDYILYRANTKFSIVTRECQLALDRLHIPSKPEATFNYSDHAAVHAVLEITPSGT